MSSLTERDMACWALSLEGAQDVTGLTRILGRFMDELAHLTEDERAEHPVVVMMLERLREAFLFVDFEESMFREARSGCEELANGASENG
jgi:hypothetical protein